MVYREQVAICPGCGGRLVETKVTGHAFLKCPACGGIWIEQPMLACMVDDMSPGAVPSFAPRSVGAGEGKTRLCPACRRPMAAELLLDVPVERCAPHGVWMDAPELQAVLIRARPGA